MKKIKIKIKKFYLIFFVRAYFSRTSFQSSLTINSFNPTLEVVEFEPMQPPHTSPTAHTTVLDIWRIKQARRVKPGPVGRFCLIQ